MLRFYFPPFVAFGQHHSVEFEPPFKRPTKRVVGGGLSTLRLLYINLFLTPPDYLASKFGRAGGSDAALMYINLR